MNSDNQEVMRDRLRYFLDQKGLVDKDVAALINISPQNFSNYLTGKRTVTDRFLAKVSKAIDVPFETLRYGNIISSSLTHHNSQTDIARDAHITTSKGRTIIHNGKDVDVIDKLERLANLKERGILTEEEFQVQKQKILQS